MVTCLWVMNRFAWGSFLCGLLGFSRFLQAILKQKKALLLSFQLLLSLVKFPRNVQEELSQMGQVGIRPGLLSVPKTILPILVKDITVEAGRAYSLSFSM